MTRIGAESPDPLGLTALVSFFFGLGFPNISNPADVEYFSANFRVEDTAVVPEPATMTLLGVGLAGIGARR